MIRSAGRLLKSRDGATSLEFALVGPVLLLLLLGIPAGSFVLWARGAVQVAASQTARCKATGSTDCNDATAYATSRIKDWGVAAFVSSVSASVDATSNCNNVTGTFVSVTVTGTAGLGGTSTVPLTSVVLTATACYPSGA